MSFSFEGALNYLKGGNKVARSGWNGPNQYAELRYSEDFGRKILCLKNSQGDIVPWVPSMSDLFADDWDVVD